MLLKQLSRLAVSLALISLPLAARQTQEPPAHVTLQGVVRTAAGAPVPGASVHIVEENSGKSWVTWTDELGKFRLPELPGGKYKIDASQIGFGDDTKELTPTSETSPDIILSLHIATASEIAAANAATAAAQTPATTPTKAAAVQNATPPATAEANGNKPPATAGTQPANQGRGATQSARNGGGRGQQGAGRGGRGGGFSQVDVSGNGANAGEGDNTAAGAGNDALGNAESADALLVAGTTAQGATNMGGFPNMGDLGGLNPNGPGGIPGGDNGTGIPGGMPGGMPGGGAGPGGGGGRGGGGGGFGGGGRGGGPGGGGRGGRGGPGQNGVPWGLNSVIRRRINQMHYTLNETLNDSAFDARNFDLTTNAETKPAFTRNNFGGSLGGPLRIPKIYDGRDKTYFFINTNFVHGTNATNNSYTNVPTDAERAGNFCSAGPGGTPILLYDYTSNFNGPRSLLNVPGNCDLQGQINPNTSQPYVSPLATTILNNYFPEPNITDNSTYNYLLQTTTPTNTQLINSRVNQTINQKLNFGVVYNISQNQNSGVGLFPELTSHTAARGQNVTLTFNQNISQRLINAIALNFTRQRTDLSNENTDVLNVENQLGITGPNTFNPEDWGLPTLSFTPTGGLTYAGLSDTNASLRKNETWNLSDTVSYNLPKHTLHLGFTFRKVQLNSLADPDAHGRFSFTGLFTQNYQLTGSTETPVPNTGSALADFLMGLPAGQAVQYSTTDTENYLRMHGFIGYVTDNWIMFPRFTVTYGLRYELMIPPTELNNRLSNLDVSSTFGSPTVVTPGTVGPFSGALPNSLIRTNYNNFAPRIAIAWRVPGKYFDKNNGRHALIVRAGYSVTDVTSTYNTLATNYLVNQSPFAIESQPTASATQTLSLQNISTAAPVNVYAVSPNYHNPYVQIWNLSLESQFIDGWTWQLMYVGTKGTDLDQLIAPNVLSVTSPALTGGTIQPSLAFTYDTSGASSNYNALQARLLKRMRNGFTFQTIYTYSKALDDSSSIGGTGGTVVQEYPFFNLERGLSTFDMRHSITGNATYELPFGERKHWAHKGAEARILGNWRLSGSTTFHTGTPLTPVVDEPAFSGITGSSTFVTRPDILPGCNPVLPADQRSLGQFFNTACFAAPGELFPGTTITAPGNLFGDAGRDIVTGPASFIVNVALQRTITLDRDGQKHLDIRWETNNIANHVNWSGIGLTDPVGGNLGNFGVVNSAGAMRTMDLVVRLNF